MIQIFLVYIKYINFTFYLSLSNVKATPEEEEEEQEEGTRQRFIYRDKRKRLRRPPPNGYCCGGRRSRFHLSLTLGKGDRWIGDRYDGESSTFGK